MTGHVAFEALAAGHALDALEPEDEQVFLQHLAGCARCERELAAHQETAAELAYGAGPVEPPEELLVGIREAVVAESGPEAFAEATPVPAPGATGGSAFVVPLRARRRSPRAAGVLAAAAGAVLVAGLVGSNVALRQDQQQQLAWGERLTEAVRTMEQPGRSVPLTDDRERVAAVAVLHGDQVSLVVDGLAPNEGDTTTYVLWEVSRFGGKRAIGTFDVRDDGVEVLRDLPLQTPADDVAAFAVTHEHGNTPPAAPQSAPLASGTVAEA